MKDTDFRTLMESLNSIIEGVDTSPEDLENNHSDIYNFITDITGPYTIQTAKVQSFDLGGSHHVYVKMQPTAGIGNTKAVMDSKNIQYFNKGNEIAGKTPGFEFTISDDNMRGNITETWGFKILNNNVTESTQQDRNDMEELIQSYNEEYSTENGSEAEQTDTGKVTITSLDDYETIFTGDLEDFKEYCEEYGIELTTGYDDESAYGLTTAQRNY